jgi:hypothetical protein
LLLTFRDKMEDIRPVGKRVENEVPYDDEKKDGYYGDDVSCSSCLNGSALIRVDCRLRRTIRKRRGW